MASSLMYEFEDKEQNVYACSQKKKKSSPSKEEGEISLNGDVSVQVARHGFCFFSICIDLRLNFVCNWTACWHSPNTAGRCI